MSLTQEQLELIKLYRQLTKPSGEGYDGTLEQANRLADEFTEAYGIKAMVIRKKNRYDWVSEYYFKTYKYNGKIYYETSPNLEADAEV